MIEDDNYALPVLSFDNEAYKVSWQEISFDPYRQEYLYSIRVEELEVRYVYWDDNARRMNLLSTGQFKIRIGNVYSEPETVEFNADEQLLKLTVYSPQKNFNSITVHLNKRYFVDDRRPWQVPRWIKRVFGPL
ncbi:ORF-123 peptide [Chrysodeixis chalcites nucleopolyhedrovirus]|uniref:ORF-123 peptide n=1 Tax=Chrysodeixis chalcites nucleopolyhedrovirus TaxID=320432 RepID=Q4KSV7_9ABAC|nr:ORF-123 peptide [Chrysodeixis chalcites nucleopolyhedrovirus]AGC36337.1 hypothetical protein TF1A_00123 [Chrysodeixis chalcites SNPV TF1-A]AAY84054.1 ORF-123 peptide [Chrysodeixis chalcites nucleopolyhedrovirus]AGE61382.1 hypothetical protein [Chrysodeixis chalcites nucleopolyhedrovirus]AGE61529.1 hypothetical protein [Chrysodeixis chalcites nucleopolyhedrovirus]AGE61683.1 hypothetical protein [Chrysodeixis chalcites nucleopolyhedrovirus]